MREEGTPGTALSLWHLSERILWAGRALSVNPLVLSSNIFVLLGIHMRSYPLACLQRLFICPPLPLSHHEPPPLVAPQHLCRAFSHIGSAGLSWSVSGLVYSRLPVCPVYSRSIPGLYPVCSDVRLESVVCACVCVCVHAAVCLSLTPDPLCLLPLAAVGRGESQARGRGAGPRGG